MTDSPLSAARSNVTELSRIVEALDPVALDEVVHTIARASRVFFTGVGRSGLVARAIAMRLMHVGIPTFAVGEIATPGIEAGDLLVAVTSSGRGSVLQQARTANEIGADVLVVTAAPESGIVELASIALILPARTEVPTQQHAGSLFEQAALVVGDALLHSVQQRLRVPSAELDRRHANLA